MLKMQIQKSPKHGSKRNISNSILRKKYFQNQIQTTVSMMWLIGQITWRLLMDTPYAFFLFNPKLVWLGPFFSPRRTFFFISVLKVSFYLFISLTDKYFVVVRFSSQSMIFFRFSKLAHLRIYPSNLSNEYYLCHCAECLWMTKAMKSSASCLPSTA